MAISKISLNGKGLCDLPRPEYKISLDLERKANKRTWPKMYISNRVDKWTACNKRTYVNLCLHKQTPWRNNF